MSFEYKYPTFPEFSSASNPFQLHFHDQPVFRSLGAAAKPEPEFAPLSSLKVSDLSMPSMNWSLSGRTENSKKAGLDFDVSPSFSLGTRPIREKPCYFEKHTSFTSSEAPATIFDSVVRALNELRVDFEFQHLKNKIKGVCFPNNVQCVFRVNVFRAEDSYLVEFQRRQGCVLAFSGFYADVRKIMTGKAIASKAIASTFVAPEDPAGLDNVSIENLVRMASSSLADVQREGLRTLANCARTPSNRKLLLGACGFLSEILSSSSDTEVVRLASELAGHLSSSPSRDALGVAESIFQALESQSSNLSLSGRSTKRALAQAAVGYSQSHKKHFRQEKYVSCLEKYSCSADEQIRIAVGNALDTLVF